MCNNRAPIRGSTGLVGVVLAPSKLSTALCISSGIGGKRHVACGMWHVACCFLAINVIVASSADMISYVKTIRSSPSTSRNWGLYLHHRWLQRQGKANCSQCGNSQRCRLSRSLARWQRRRKAQHDLRRRAFPPPQKKAFIQSNRYKTRSQKICNFLKFCFSYFSDLFSLTARLSFLGLYALKIYMYI